MKKILWTTALISLCASNLLAQDTPNQQDTNKEERKPVEIKKLSKTGYFLGGGIGVGGKQCWESKNTQYHSSGR